MYLIEYRNLQERERVLIETDDLKLARMMKHAAEVLPYTELVSANF